MTQFSILRFPPLFWRSCLILLIVASVAFFPRSQATAHKEEGVKHTFSVASGMQITLSRNWERRFDIDPPSAPSLLFSAPQFGFTDFVVLENRGGPAILEMGESGNPFLGTNSVQLDTVIHETLLPSLFHLFFPPRSCLASAKSAFEAELRKQKDEEDQAPTIHLSQECSFSVAPLDFYASQLSSAITLQGTRSERHLEPTLHKFYLTPMEQIEIGDKTLFIFEARADHALQLREVQHFGLADDRQGARAHFFWAIGATTPFPFARDPQRKSLQIFHLVYATLGFDGEAREEFRSMLGSLQFSQ